MNLWAAKEVADGEFFGGPDPGMGRK